MFFLARLQVAILSNMSTCYFSPFSAKMVFIEAKSYLVISSMPQRLRHLAVYAVMMLPLNTFMPANSSDRR